MNNIAKLYNYPIESKLRKIVKANHPEISAHELDLYFNKTAVLGKKNKSTSGHIVAFFPNDKWNLDIIVMEKYKKWNKTAYILLAIDIFSRKVYAAPLISKSTEHVLHSFKSILKKAGDFPRVINSDSESAFLSAEFKQFLHEHEIILEAVPMGDHNALGIIDRFVRTLRDILQRKFIATKSLKWEGSLKDIIRIYNKSPHVSLDNISPDDANDNPEYFRKIYLLNKMKSLKNQELPHNKNPKLKEGDFVRIQPNNKTFKKGSEPQLSNRTYRVEKVNGKRVTIDEGQNKTYSIDNLVKTKRYFNQDTLPSDNPVNELNIRRAALRRLYREGLY